LWRFFFKAIAAHFLRLVLLSVSTKAERAFGFHGNQVMVKKFVALSNSKQISNPFS